MTGNERSNLRREDLHADPVVQFARWFRDAREDGGLDLPEAVCLSTVDEDGFPAGRMVLLKGFDEDGFVFYTNLTSTKADSLRRLPKAALTFYWEPLRRQVRIQGEVEPVSEEEADAYFSSRPRGSQIGAWASDQSAPVEDREALEERFEETRERFEGTEDLPRPPFWSGFRVQPRSLEFWQEGPDRMHDRFLYRWTRRGWALTRLHP